MLLAACHHLPPEAAAAPIAAAWTAPARVPSSRVDPVSTAATAELPTVRMHVLETVEFDQVPCRVENPGRVCFSARVSVTGPADPRRTTLGPTRLPDGVAPSSHPSLDCHVTDGHLVVVQPASPEPPPAALADGWCGPPEGVDAVHFRVESERWRVTEDALAPFRTAPAP